MRSISQKKGQSMSLNTIVVAIIVLIVLVVIVIIFTGQLRKTSEGTQSAQAPYSGDRCIVPGTLRTCRTQDECSKRSGIDYGTLDCTGASVTCCSS